MTNRSFSIMASLPNKQKIFCTDSRIHETLCRRHSSLPRRTRQTNNGDLPESLLPHDCVQVRDIPGEVLAVKLTMAKPSGCFFVGETTLGNEVSGEAFPGRDAHYDFRPVKEPNSHNYPSPSECNQQSLRKHSCRPNQSSWRSYS